MLAAYTALRERLTARLELSHAFLANIIQSPRWGGARANRGEIHVTDFGRQRPQHGSVEARKGNGDIGALGNMELCEMAESGGLSWEAQEVFQKIKSFGRLPGSGVPLIQLNMRVGSARTVKKGIPELKSAGLITDTASGEPTLTDKGHKTSV